MEYKDKVSIAAIALLLCIVAMQPAHAQSSQASYPVAINNASFIDSNDAFKLDARVGNVAAKRFNRCRYIDNNSDKPYFVPMGKDADWASFITAAPSDVTLALCRPSYDFTYDFSGSGLTSSQRMTYQTGIVSLGSGQYTDTSITSGALSQSYSYPLARSVALDETKSNVINYQRRDCRPNTSHTGASRGADVCSTQAWVGTGNVEVKFTPSNGSARSTSTSDGAWSLTALDKTGAPPTVSIPENRPCPPSAHGTYTWVDGVTQTRSAYTPSECADLPGSATYTRTEQNQYLCWDGTDEPTGAVQYTSWTFSGGSCACTQYTETQYVGCPSGYSGTVTQQRTRNVGTTCGNDSGWSDVASTCTPNTVTCGWGEARDPNTNTCVNISVSVVATETDVMFFSNNWPAYPYSKLQWSAYWACTRDGYTRLVDFAGYNASGNSNDDRDFYYRPQSNVNSRVFIAGSDTGRYGFMKSALCSTGNFMTPNIDLVASSNDPNAVNIPSGAAECPADLGTLPSTGNSNYFLNAKVGVAPHYNGNTYINLMTASQFDGSFTPTVMRTEMDCYQRQELPNQCVGYHEPDPYMCEYYGMCDGTCDSYETQYNLYHLTGTLH